MTTHYINKSMLISHEFMKLTIKNHVFTQKSSALLSMEDTLPSDLPSAQLIVMKAAVHASMTHVPLLLPVHCAVCILANPVLREEALLGVPHRTGVPLLPHLWPLAGTSSSAPHTTPGVPPRNAREAVWRQEDWTSFSCVSLHTTISN